MAIDKTDNGKTIELVLETDEKQLIADAIKTHSEKIARKAAADAPKSIKELWYAELKKLEELARKVLK